jgi:hypothetical protein
VRRAYAGVSGEKLPAAIRASRQGAFGGSAHVSTDVKPDPHLLQDSTDDSATSLSGQAQSSLNAPSRCAVQHSLGDDDSDDEVDVSEPAVPPPIVPEVSDPAMAAPLRDTADELIDYLV